MSIGYLSQNGMNRVFEQWSQTDPNINQYGFGQLYNQNGTAKVKQMYPGIWVNPVNTIPSIDLYTVTRSYQIIIYDLVFDTGATASQGGLFQFTPETNQNAVISDSEEIAFRLIRFLKSKSDIFDVSGTPTITPFTDRWLDDVSGVIIDIAIEFNAESSDCEDPSYIFNIQNNTI
jgi:hypothetical protein